MVLELDKVAPDARSFKGRYVRQLEGDRAQKAKESHYRQFLTDLGVDSI